MTETAEAQLPLTLREAVEWRPLVWEPAARWALARAEDVLRPGNTVLEVGYGSGLMSCYLAARYGVTVVGYDIDAGAQRRAGDNARRFGVDHLVDFRHCEAAATLSIDGHYDAVFVKSVLYRVPDAAQYRAWLAWIGDRLADGGAFVAVENARGSRITGLYRRLAYPPSREWASLFDDDRLGDVTAAFGRVEYRCFGRYSQFAEPLPWFGSALFRLDERLRPPLRSAFVAAVVARR